VRKKIPVAILASGGIDSTALIHRYRVAKDPVHVVHFQYGQPSGRSELKSVKLVCKHFNVKLAIVNLGFRMFLRGYEFLGRNALFVLAACSLGPPPLRVCLGLNRGPEYYDISQRFVTDCQRLLDGYFGGTVVLEAPLVDYSKRDIIRYCKQRQIPLGLTYSCQAKNSPPCGHCPSCLDREKFLGEK